MSEFYEVLLVDRVTGEECKVCVRWHSLSRVNFNSVVSDAIRRLCGELRKPTEFAFRSLRLI